MAKKVTTAVLQKMKSAGDRITALTAYDHLFAGLLDAAGVDVLLVGDSVGTVVQGHDTTVPVTMEQMLYHTELVSRGSQRALVVADMPFLSYQVSPEQALRHAGQLLQTGGAEAVKLEGGAAVLKTVQRLHDAGIPVMGHLGLTPQSIHQFGSYQVRGKQDQEAEQIRVDALGLQAAGAFALVLEKVPAGMAAQLSKELTIPTIGIGAGPGCDGQILVTQDLLGLFTRFRPRFVRRYAELGDAVSGAIREYVKDVQGGEFPGPDESY